MQEPKRTDVINFLVTKFNLQRYCEIGLQRPEQNFDKIISDYKVSVDPDLNAHATYCMTSDQFFEVAAWNIGYNDRKFSIIFLDGLHSAEQLQNDFYNCLKYLSPDGWICMHDTNPESEDLTHFPRDKSGSWNGSCYKFAASLLVPNGKKFTVGVDHGVTCVQPKGKYEISDPSTWIVNNWRDFDKNRKELLNLISWDEFLAI